MNKLDNNNVLDAISTDLSKALDYKTRDLLVAKFDAYGFHRNTAAYIYSYLENRNQCVRINGTQSYLGDIISVVPQGSILGPILSNLFFNDFFRFILLSTAHNFADDSTLLCFGKTIQQLIGFLESECKVALTWFDENKMIVNPGKFQGMIMDKRKQDHTKEIFRIGSKEIIKLYFK